MSKLLEQKLPKLIDLGEAKHIVWSGDETREVAAQSDVFVRSAYLDHMANGPDDIPKRSFVSGNIRVSVVGQQKRIENDADQSPSADNFADVFVVKRIRVICERSCGCVGGDKRFL